VRDALDRVLQWLTDAPEPLVHVVVALLSALENVVPPVPADVVIVFAGFLAARRGMSIGPLFLSIWIANVVGALAVYAMGRRYGGAFFRTRVGSALLHPGQMRRLDHFYHRYGPIVIFVSRFLPVVRSVVPAFAGVSRVGFWRTTLPLAAASGLWYGMLVQIGAVAGANWELAVDTLAGAGRGLGLVAALLVAAAFVWWWRTRHADGS
jgi:membrane protein DedA with SNARE-associated domain